MDRPRQLFQPSTRQDRLSYPGLAVLFGISCLSFLSGCAQLDQLMGKRADAVEPAPPAQTAAPTPPPSVPETQPVKAAKPSAKPAATQKAEEPRHVPAATAKDPLQRAPAVPEAAPVTGVAKESESQIKKTDQDKALAETDQPKKEKKSRVASDKKSKKSPRSQDEPKSPTDDLSLPPVPLPSKPAAIGGSGG